MLDSSGSRARPARGGRLGPRLRGGARPRSGRRLRRAELHPPLHAGPARRPALRGALGPEPTLGRRHRRAGGLGDDDREQHRRRRRDRQRRRLRPPRPRREHLGQPGRARRRHRQRRQRLRRRRPRLGLRPGRQRPRSTTTATARTSRARSARSATTRSASPASTRTSPSCRCARAGSMASKTPTSSRPSTTPATTAPDVVNGSFGGPDKSLALANLLKSVPCRNTLFVFAAGNDGAVLTNNTAATNAYPCEYHRPAPHGFSVPNVVCVAASTKSDTLASFSNRGPAAVHLAAPGGNGCGTPSQEILSTWPGYHNVFGPDDMETAGTWGDQVNVGDSAAAAAVGPQVGRRRAPRRSRSPTLRQLPQRRAHDDPQHDRDRPDAASSAASSTTRRGSPPNSASTSSGSSPGSTTSASDEEIAAWSGSTSGQFIPLRAT